MGMFKEKEKDPRFQKVMYFIEATSSERMEIWHNYRFNQDSSGLWMQIGTFWRQPVTISVLFAELGGAAICFFEATSNVVNHEMVENWIDYQFKPRTHDDRRAIVDANNFHNAVREIEHQTGNKVEFNHYCNHPECYPHHGDVYLRSAEEQRKNAAKVKKAFMT